ncbi:tRNA dimethylallyltransferase [Paramicrobacterium humi]|uniref:tRNA dimethylallyltransferase n=1 Tax=Paramicrobacterium humi TaxID=640635 RepID=A0A1H4PSE8_9MICO|nr:tRNA dimethylallyltransferase [Microbacterium humi]
MVVVGPTGTGKSELSLDLVERLADAGRPAEIVNADAMQLYRGMDIGTAKLAVDERRGIPHHLLDVLDVTEDATVAGYQPRARHVIDALCGDGITPVLVGGSGLYVSSVIFAFQFPGTDPLVRARLEGELEADGRGSLYRRLHELDPAVAARIGPHNARRIVRALEIAELTGTPAAGMLPDEPEYWRPVTLIGLQLPREELTERLDGRVQRMWDAGLLAEVRGLMEQGLKRSTTAGRAIGYAQAAAQLSGECSESEAISDTQRLTRRYARRQMSWFRRYRDLHWLDAASASLPDDALEIIARNEGQLHRP